MKSYLGVTLVLCAWLLSGCSASTASLETCGTSSGTRVIKNIPVRVVDGKLSIDWFNETVYFSPRNSDDITWTLEGDRPNQELRVTFSPASPLKTKSEPAGSKTKKKLILDGPKKQCQANKYSLSLEPPLGVEPLDPVIIIRD